MVLFSLALLPIGCMPTWLGMAGTLSFWGSLLLGVVFLHFTVRAALTRSNAHAKRVLHASVAYLPLLFALLMLDKR